MAVITGSQLAGVTMVTVSGDRTQLTLSGVQREVNGATVVCSAIGSTGNVDSDPATITVQCTLIVEAVRVWTVLATRVTLSLKAVFIYAIIGLFNWLLIYVYMCSI